MSREKQRKQWNKTLEEGLPIKESERQSVRKIMSRLRSSPEPDPVSKSDPVSEANPVSLIPGVKLKPGASKEPGTPKEPGNYSTPNALSDVIAPQLTDAEFKIYHRLHRLSYGFNKDTCRVGLRKLANHCNMGLSTARRALRGLQLKGLIVPIGHENTGTKEGGTEYRVHLEFPSLSPGIRDEPGAKMTPGTKMEPGVKTRANTHCAIQNNVDTQNAVVRAQLIEFGFTPKTADYLIRQCTPEEIRRQIEAYPFHARDKAIKNPPGFLRKAILENWPLPPAYAEASTEAPARSAGRESAPAESGFDEETVAAYYDFLNQQAEADLNALTPEELAAARRALLTESLHKEYYQRCQAAGTLTPEVLRKGLIAERRRFLEANHSLIRFAETHRKEGN